MRPTPPSVRDGAPGSGRLIPCHNGAVTLPNSSRGVIELSLQQQGVLAVRLRPIRNGIAEAVRRDLGPFPLEQFDLVGHGLSSIFTAARLRKDQIGSFGIRVAALHFLEHGLH